MGDKLKIERPVAVYIQIEEHLREKIRSGELRPGDRLPSVPEMAAELEVHEVTVQKALRRLKMAGLLYRTPKVGTFVRSSPDQMHIGIFFGPTLSDEEAHFYRAVNRCLRRLIEKNRQHYRTYDDVNEAKELRDINEHPAFQHYLADRKNHIFGGGILVGVDHHLIEVLRKREEYPLVFGSGKYPDADVYTDHNHFLSESLAYLAARGKKKIGFLRYEEDGTPGCSYPELLAQYGLEDYGVDVCGLNSKNHVNEAQAFERISERIRKWQKTGRWPEALVVADDIAMRGVALALLGQQVDVPGKLEVVCRSNQGIIHHYGLPVTQYEISPQEFSAHLYRILCNRMSKGPKIPVPVLCRGKIIPPPGE